MFPVQSTLEIVIPEKEKKCFKELMKYFGRKARIYEINIAHELGSNRPDDPNCHSRFRITISSCWAYNLKPIIKILEKYEDWDA